MTGPGGGPTPVFVVTQGLIALGVSPVEAGGWARALAYDLWATGHLVSDEPPGGGGTGMRVPAGGYRGGSVLPAPTSPDPGVSERSGVHRREPLPGMGSRGWLILAPRSWCSWLLCQWWLACPGSGSLSPRPGAPPVVPGRTTTPGPRQ